ncbi:DRMBL-domain-containing protein [Wallemia mellicola]|nr:DRMBL-domain-containing protein [Wallemia mellicola]TIB86708.1 DRMBL-domain-containing protein [Wallemia mellicola]TIC47986.1 DRMBL-domain-containing protein [Wallemia mellicola]
MNCPICKKNLDKFDESAANYHINRCMDTGIIYLSSDNEEDCGKNDDIKALDCTAADDKDEEIIEEFEEIDSLNEDYLKEDISKLPIDIDNSPPQKKAKLSAFNILMSSNNDTNAYNEATAMSSKSIPKNQRKTPFYKILEGMPIAVDAFMSGKIPGVEAYVLSHAHSDHYQSLSKNWDAGPIYCSIITASLVHHICGVPKEYLRPLSNDTAHVIPSTNGVTVTLIDANHCPGSSIFVFEGKQSVHAGDSNFKSPWIGSDRIFRYLHCGDFRASPQHVNHPAIKGKKFDAVYLDTTYLNPNYSFPPQRQVIDACRDLVLANLRGEMQVNESMLDMLKSGFNRVVSSAKNEEEEEKEEKKISQDVLIVVGTYSIGKERIVKDVPIDTLTAVAKAINSKIFADKRRQALLRNEKDEELNNLLTEDPYDSQVHIQGLGGVTMNTLPDYLSKFKKKYNRVIGLKPTGWTYKNASSSSSELDINIEYLLKRDLNRSFTYRNLFSTRGSNDTVACYGIPYSEHSSFTELTCFALSIDHVRMIATVNVGKQASRERMKKWFGVWHQERRKRLEKGLKQVPARAKDYW